MTTFPLHPETAASPARSRSRVLRAQLASAALVLALVGCTTPGTRPTTTDKPRDPPLAKGWVVIPSRGKQFQMGQEFTGKRWTYTSPVHPVSFTYDFAMCATQVTQAEYARVTGVNPTTHPGDERRPIDNVTWFDAVLYCNALSRRDGLEPVYVYGTVTGDARSGVTALADVSYDIKKNGYRLPTSAEFEYVTRAGTTTTWFFGGDDADQSIAKEYAWCDLNSGKTTHPVGLLKPNAYGVYDISGNLWMWCGDWYDGPYPTEAQVDPTGPVGGVKRVARGGAFKNNVAHERSAYHWQWEPDRRNFEVGFRIVRTLR